MAVFRITAALCLLFGAHAKPTKGGSCPVGEYYNSYTGQCDPVPSWTIPEGETETVCFDSTWASGGKAHTSGRYPTCVSMSYTDTHVNFLFEVFNDNIQMNAYGPTCNLDMYNQEVVEMFITDDMESAKPEHYYEIVSWVFVLLVELFCRCACVCTLLLLKT